MDFKKILILTILAIFSVAGLIILIPFIQDIIYAKSLSDDILEAGLLLIPSLFSGFLFYKLAKNPELFDKYKKTIIFFVYGVVITIIVSLITGLILIISSADGLSFFGALAIPFLGAFISFVAAFVGWLMDKKSRE